MEKESDDNKRFRRSSKKRYSEVEGIDASKMDSFRNQRKWKKDVKSTNDFGFNLKSLEASELSESHPVYINDGSDRNTEKVHHRRTESSIEKYSRFTSNSKPMHHYN